MITVCAHYSLAIEVLRFGIVLPSALAIMTITYTHFYERYYAIAAQIVAPLHATCFIAMDVMLRPQGFSLSAWMVLVVLASYFMYGLMLREGIRTVAIILAMYVMLGMLAELDSPQWRMDLAAITFAATFADGACVTPAEGRSPFGLIQLANEALYAAKERGRNRIAIMDHQYATLKTGAFRSFKPRTTTTQ